MRPAVVMRPVRSSGSRRKKEEPRLLAALRLSGCLLVARPDPGPQRIQDERLNGHARIGGSLADVCALVLAGADCDSVLPPIVCDSRPSLCLCSHGITSKTVYHSQ